MVNLPTFLASSWLTATALPTVLIYGVTFLGSLLTYFYTSTKGLEGTIPILRRRFPDRSPLFYLRLDFLAMIVIGPIFSFICFNPADTLEALAAGCGWVSAINILTLPTPLTPQQATPDPDR